MKADYRRRMLCAFMAAGGAAFPLAVLAKTWRIGIMTGGSATTRNDPYWRAFVQALRELGYVEGRNLQTEWRFGEGHFERMPKYAEELVALKVDLIVASAPPSVRAAQKATTSIPIVLVAVGNPERLGFVASLRRPGGNITGPSNVIADLGVKYLELLRSLLPKVTRVGVLTNPLNPVHAITLENIHDAAAAHGVKVVKGEARNPKDIDRGFEAMVSQGTDAGILLPDGVFTSNRKQLTALAASARVPMIYPYREYVDDGGLASYGENFSDYFRRAAVYVDKILRGAKPADLPVEQSSKLELVINLKAAKLLGVVIPQPLLLRADVLIQ